MKIIIETDTDTEPEVVFNQFKEWCELGLSKFKLQIEGTELKFEKLESSN